MNVETVEPLAMRAKEVVKLLGISDHKLWELTKRGAIPHFRIDTAVLYPVDEIRTWAEEHSQSLKTKPRQQKSIAKQAGGRTAKKRRRGNGQGTLYKNQGRGCWIASWYDHTGKRRTKSTRITDKRTAERILAKYVADVASRLDFIDYIGE